MGPGDLARPIPISKYVYICVVKRQPSIRDAQIRRRLHITDSPLADVVLCSAPSSSAVRLMVLTRVQLTLTLLTSVTCQRLQMAWRSHGADNADMVRLLRRESPR